MRCAFKVFVLVLIWAGSVAALEAPQSQPLLSVQGQISETNVDDQAQFDRAMLEAMDWQEIETFTSFTQGSHSFAGPPLLSFLEALGAQGALIRATAIDDYAVEITFEQMRKHSPIMALEQNGKPMSLRSKGPIWIVFPQTEREAANNTFYAEMIWQLVRIDVLP
ncbi:MAG: oxidoreductase [Pelagimonas sp.]|uniref:oxidoreductase n=1 Tax=Pelagimonas sp. TaxID=2073170 RepID=UPI003D6B7A12